MRIEKKTWPSSFQKILDGEKTFELRLADFSCSPGDVLVLKEWDPKTKTYTGRSIEKKVTQFLTSAHRTARPSRTGRGRRSSSRQS